MANNGDFADVMIVDCQAAGPVRAVAKKSLAIFVADGLPVDQAWLELGDTARVADVVASRLEARRSRFDTPIPPYSTSVVICTRDRPNDLRRCLVSLTLQTRPPDEVIVVDNASGGRETRDVVEAAGVRYLREDRPGLDFARNCGARAATGDLVIYTDDDTELHPDWIGNTIRAFDDPAIAAVTGLVLPATLKTEAQWLFEDQWSFGRGYDRIDYDSAFYTANRSRGCPAWIIGAGANMAFRRGIFDEIGYFDERLDVGQAGCSGDSEYWYRLLASGHTCRYEPTAVIWHHHRLRIEDLNKQIYAYMRGHAAALMVQYERTGDRGNLRRAFLTMPNDYLRRFIRRMRDGKKSSNRFLSAEVRGMAAGLIFYFRSPRPN